MSSKKDHRRRVGGLGAMVLVFAALNGSDATAMPPTPYRPLSDFQFQPVLLAPVSQPVPPIVDTDRTNRSIPTALPQRPAPRPQPGVLLASVRPSDGSFSATYYCLSGQSRCTAGYPDGSGLDLYAAISPDFSGWEGRQLQVCNGSSCVTVTVIDCNCQATRAIDLYADAFVQIARLRQGRINVTITPLE